MKTNNPTDYSLETTTISRTEIFPDRELKSGKEPAFSFESEVTVANQKIDTNESDKRATFNQNLRYWNEQTGLLSANNFQNAYFKGIVNMGQDAVPFIKEQMEKGPTPLVHALDLIFPGTIEYDGFVSLSDACEKWLSILKQID